MATVKKLTSWSFSRYGDYKKCPLSAKLKHIDKIQEPKGPAMARGIDIHNMAEAYIKGTLKKLPPELALLKDEFNKLKALYKKKALPVIVEDNWAFTKDWTETSWQDWVGCWVRIKLDAAHYSTETRLVVTDWKSGKFRVEQNEDYLEQLELYALAAFLLHEHIEEVEPRLAYTDEGVFYPPADKPIVYTRKDIPRLRKLWDNRVKPMMNDTSFLPKPNDKCRWCFYGQSGKVKGGPGLCKY